MIAGSDRGGQNRQLLLKGIVLKVPGSDSALQRAYDSLNVVMRLLPVPSFLKCPVKLVSEVAEPR